MSDNVMGIIISLGLCVLLPIVITWLVLKSKSLKVNRKYDLLTKALEHGVEINPELLIDNENQAFKNLKMQLIKKLQNGVIFFALSIACVVCMMVYPEFATYIFTVVAIITFALGLGNIIAYIVGIRQLRPEIEAEEQALKEKGE